MRKNWNGTALCARNLGVRKCIAESLIWLLERKHISEVTVTELVKQAHVSRMTFYKYYRTKKEALEDYLYEIVDDYVLETEQRTDIGEFGDYVHLCHCLEYFRDYSGFIRVLLRMDMYSLLIKEVNRYMEEQYHKMKKTSYELYYYAGAVCNVYTKWVENGLKEPPEEVARSIIRGTRI